MEENQNDRNMNETPRTYGEESKLYESGQVNQNQANYGAGQNPYSQPQAGGQAYGNGQANYGAGQNPYSQPGMGGQTYGNGQPGYGGQAYGNNQANYGAGQNPYSQPQAGGQAYGNGQANYGAGQNPYNQPNYNGQAYGNGQPGYGGQNPYGYQPNGNWQGNTYPQMQHAPVTDVFCNILLAIFLIRMILSFCMMGQVFEAMDDYDSIMNGSYMLALAGSSYQVLASLSNLLFVATIVFIVLDIVNIHKANYKITGLILFALLLNPGYYLWRAHILGRRKTFPIIYTVVYGGAMAGYFIYTFYKTFTLVFEMTQSLMY